LQEAKGPHDGGVVHGKLIVRGGGRRVMAGLTIGRELIQRSL